MVKKKVLLSKANSWNDSITIYRDSVRIIIAKLGFFGSLGIGTMRTDQKPGEKLINTEDIKSISYNPGSLGLMGQIHIDIKNAKSEIFCWSPPPKNLSNPEEYRIKEREEWWLITQHLGKIAGLNCEGNLEEDRAIELFEEFSLDEEAKRVRQKMREEKKVDQTIVHGDYIDDRDTIVKDSVINRSNVGAGEDDKVAKLEKIANLKKEGLIDDDEFKQMKKEILGK
jgi:hypothetical protein